MPQMANESTTQNAEPTGGAPPPPSPPTSPPGQPTGTQRPPPPVDGKTFYGYLYNKDKTPTALLDALLRAIGKHIVCPVLSCPALLVCLHVCLPAQRHTHAGHHPRRTNLEIAG